MSEEAATGEQEAQSCNLHSLHLHSRLQGLVLQIWDNGAACMFSVSLLFAGANFFIKVLNFSVLRYSVFQIVATRSGFAIPFTVLSIRRMQQEDPENGPSIFGNSSNYKRLLMRGLFGASAMCSYYLSIQMLTLGDAVTLFFTNAVVTSGASVLMGYEKPTWGMLLACCSCAGGVLLISRPSFLFGAGQRGADMLWGVMVALASSCFAAGAFLTIKTIGKDEKAITIAMWFHTVSIIVSCVPMMFSLPFPPVLPTAHEAVMLLFLGVSSFLGQLLLSRGFQLLNPSVAAAVNLSQVVHSRALSVLFLQDPLPWTGVVGSVLIVVGVLSTKLGKQKQVAKDVACEAGTSGEDAVLLMDIQDDVKCLSPGGALHVLETSRSLGEPSGLEISLTDVDEPEAAADSQ